jgi:hypothetical protein
MEMRGTTSAMTMTRPDRSAYHWGEDGLAGISDDKLFLCFSLALWNNKDPILKAQRGFHRHTTQHENTELVISH